MTKRLHYIDWLRVLAVLLLFPFHSGRVFVAEPWYVSSSPPSSVIGLILPFIDMWHMPLLFVLAGMSTYLALRKRTPGQYASERGLRLGMPLLFGLLLVTPVQGWYGARMNSGYAGSFLTYLTSGKFLDTSLVLSKGDYFGGFVIGHLWFILFLLVFSLVTLPLLAWSRGERGRAAFERWSRRLARPVWWLLPAAVLWLVEGLVDLDKNPFYYVIWFLLGFAAAHDGAFAESAERLRWPAIAAGLALCAAYAWSWTWRDTLPDPSVVLTLANLGGMLGAFMAVVGMLGLGRRFLDKPSPALTYLAEASYPLYILHQTVIVILAFYLVTVPGGTLVRYPLVLAGAVGVTSALYEIVRRVRPLRFVFGMRPARAPAPAPAPAAT